jgi:hypothetical protein
LPPAARDHCREQPYTFLYISRWTGAIGQANCQPVTGADKHHSQPIVPTKTGGYTFHFNQWIKLNWSTIFGGGISASCWHISEEARFRKMVTLFFVSVISFLIIHLAPGEPSQIDPLNPKFTPEIVERMRKEFHLDKPLHVQYLLFYRDLFTGRIVSWKDNQPVLGKIWERFLNSLPLFIVGTLLTWTFSFPVGIRSAIIETASMTSPPP